MLKKLSDFNKDLESTEEKWSTYTLLGLGFVFFLSTSLTSTLLLTVFSGALSVGIAFLLAGSTLMHIFVGMYGWYRYKQQGDHSLRFADMAFGQRFPMGLVLVASLCMIIGFALTPSLASISVSASLVQLSIFGYSPIGWLASTGLWAVLPTLLIFSPFVLPAVGVFVLEAIKINTTVMQGDGASPFLLGTIQIRGARSIVFALLGITMVVVGASYAVAFGQFWPLFVAGFAYALYMGLIQDKSGSLGARLGWSVGAFFGVYLICFMLLFLFPATGFWFFLEWTLGAVVFVAIRTKMQEKLPEGIGEWFVVILFGLIAALPVVFMAWATSPWTSPLFQVMQLMLTAGMLHSMLMPLALLSFPVMCIVWMRGETLFQSKKSLTVACAAVFVINGVALGMTLFTMGAAPGAFAVITLIAMIINLLVTGNQCLNDVWDRVPDAGESMGPADRFWDLFNIRAYVDNAHGKYASNTNALLAVQPIDERKVASDEDEKKEDKKEEDEKEEVDDDDDNEISTQANDEKLDGIEENRGRSGINQTGNSN